jgi:flavin reductase (DIM6/NTAB) family NADH-FMN oxidoreductase RutF
MPDQSNQQESLAAALGRIPSGLFILTARNGVHSTGMLASWVQQCSFQPPLVTVAVNKSRAVLDWLEVGSTFTLNILGEGSRQLISHFGKGFDLTQPAFDGLSIRQDESFAPVLLDAHAYLNCRVDQRVSTGDHELFVAEVLGGQVLQAVQPTVHIRKSGLKY